MARHKSFDPEEVLAVMVCVFWRKGYEATSIADLEEATGLNKRSLYNTFGNKAAIFDKVIAAYGEMTGGAAVVLANDPPSVENIRTFFRQLSYPDEPLGCLFTKSINERDLIESETFSRIEGAIFANEELFLRNLRAEFPRRKAERLAKFLTSNVQGITTMSRLDSDMARLRDVVKSIERLLDAELEND